MSSDGISHTSEVISVTELSRESLAVVLRAFLNGQIMAFDLDDQLDVFRGSDDPVIQYVISAVWFHYDDCADHLQCLDREEWNFFQRLLLLLASDWTLETKSSRIFSFQQVVAAASLALFVFFAVQLGWGSQLLVLAVPFGAVSMLLWRTRSLLSTDSYQVASEPFAGRCDIRQAYLSTGFRKMRYPGLVADRQIRSPFMDRFYHLYWHVVWLLLSPVVLFVQAFPRTHSLVRARPL